MSDTTSFKIYFDLVEFGLTTNNETDYRASVKTNKSLTLSDIAAAIASERTDLRKETIEMVLKVADEKIIEKVCSGHTVVTGTSLIQPVVTGTFTGKSGTIDSTKNVCKISINPSTAFRQSASQVELEFSGYVKDLGGACINLVTDSRTGAIDGTITPGGGLLIEGTKIRCVNADGSGAGTISLINKETGDVTELTDILRNEPKNVSVIIPSDLGAGTYTLRIETYYSSANKQLKSVRQIDYSIALTVQSSQSSSTQTSESESSSEEESSASESE